MGQSDPKIAELHQLDIKATEAFDPKLLAELWTDDAVRIINGRVDAGKAQIRGWDEMDKDGTPEGKSEYTPAYQTYPLASGWAFETGTFTLVFRATTAGGVTFRMKGEVVRLLQQQSDGRWKIAWLKSETKPFNSE